MESQTIGDDISYILAAQKLLEEDPGRQLTITALALEFGVNSFKLRVDFKETFNQTIHQYRLNLRLEFAKRLLDETDFTIAEIAYKSGFNSRDGFAKSFKKRLHLSPREWRKQQDVFTN